MEKQNIPSIDAPFYDGASMMSTSRKQSALKLTAAGKTKRFREMPETFEGLKKLVEKFFKSPDFAIQYTDDAGDVINVSDDEDLLSAYDWIQGQGPLDLKFNIEKREPVHAQLIEPMQELKVQPKKAPVYKAQPEKKESSSSSDSSSDEKDMIVQNGVQIPAFSQSGLDEKRDRKTRKKAIRKMIKKSMKAHSRELIQSMLQEEKDKLKDKDDCPQIEEKSTSGQTAGQVVHANVTCDGCGVFPIVGPRYKCTVNKNFDFCAACEATKDHPYAFLKITKPGMAPKAMFTVINEQMPGEADVDINMETEEPKWKQARKAKWEERKGGAGCGKGWRKPEGGPCFGKKWGGAGCGKGWMMDEQAQDFLKEQAEAFGMHFAGGDPHVMKKKIGWFMRQMFKGKEGFDADFTPDGDKEWRKNPKRAVVLQAPKKPLFVCPGDEATATVTYKNCGHWPYRPGFHLETVLNDETKELFEPVKLPLEEVPPMGDFTVKVPLKVKANAKTSACSGKEHYIFTVGVSNTNGEPVGVAATMKVRVIPKIEESSLYEKVQQLMALGSDGTSGKEPFTFEEAIEALKEAEYTVEMAFALLKQGEVEE